MGKLLWKPSEARVKSANISRFMSFVNEMFAKDFTDYDSLYQWSVENISYFWGGD